MRDMLERAHELLCAIMGELEDDPCSAGEIRGALAILRDIGRRYGEDQ